jgi:hypothetical protein
MRHDMARVIVERPRRGGGRTRKGRCLDPEALPSREGMRAPHVRGWGGKQLNENLQPLRRFLERQVGRPWDKVYAEISARLRVTSAVQQHVRDHLRDFVAIKPRRLESRWYQPPGNLWRQPLYVDPRTGLLCRTDQLPEVKARRPAEARRR